MLPLNSHPRRLCIFSFHDDRGVVDDYVTFLLRELRQFVEKIVACVHGDLAAGSEKKLLALVDEVVMVPEAADRLAVFGQGLELIGFDQERRYDEVLLVDDTCFGPLFPLDELFVSMDGRACDFWGITARPERTRDPFSGVSGQPFSLDMNFLAIRRALMESEIFRKYWTHRELVGKGGLSDGALFASYFIQRGFTCETYLNPDEYGTAHPAIFDVDETIRDRNPFISRRVFAAEPLLMERHAADLPRALRILGQASAYDQSLIWRSVIRHAQLRTINTNAALTSVLPDVRLKPDGGTEAYGRIAVCVHMYYTDMLDEILALADTIPGAYDFIATTDDDGKKTVIERAVAGRRNIANVIVRVVAQNRGRDMSALFITCRDLFLDDRYDLVCRLHTKKSPQVWAGRANMFKRHMFENLLNSPGFTTNVMDMFRDKPTIGVAVPPLVHIAYPTMGHVWFVNRERVQTLARDLHIHVPFDPDTPVGAFGGMFWFRPKSLRKLFLHPWKWADFDGEPYPHDGSLGHALERIICYTAQDAGYTTQQIISSHQAAWTYAMLEYKLQKLASLLPFADFPAQVAFLSEWKKAGYRPSRMAVNMRLAVQPPTIRDALIELVLALRRSFVRRFPRVANILRPLYRRWKNVLPSTRDSDET